MITVKATQRGYYSGVIREPGDEFEIKGKGQLGSWMQVIPGQESIAPSAPQVTQPPQVNEAPTPQVVTGGSEQTPQVAGEPGQTLGEINQKVLDQQSDPAFLT